MSEEATPVIYTVGEVSPEGLMLPQPPDGSVNHGACVINPAEFDVQLEADLTPEQEAAFAAIFRGEAGRRVTVQNCSCTMVPRDSRQMVKPTMAVSVYLQHNGRPIKPLRWVVSYDLGMAPDAATLDELTKQIEKSLRDLQDPDNANLGMFSKMRVVGRGGIVHGLISFVIPNEVCQTWYRDLLESARNVGIDRERLLDAAHNYSERIYTLMERVGCGLEVGWSTTVAVDGVKKAIPGPELHQLLLDGGWIASPGDEARAKKKARRPR
jgi:hypothetical protein